MEFKTKEQKALEYAKEIWGIYFDNKHPDIAIEKTQGDITVSDYIAGYDEGVKDSKAPEMLEMLKKCREYFLLKTDSKSEERAEAIGELIKEATKI